MLQSLVSVDFVQLTVKAQLYIRQQCRVFMERAIKIAVVVPTYKSRRHVLDVINGIGREVSCIYVVDDGCPDKTGEYVAECCGDDRVRVIWLPVNQGVGGAVMAGYIAAIQDDMEVIVKIDSDGQMDPTLISDFVRPIAWGEADYTKGNRFFDIEKVRSMPKLRLFGNAILSLMCKLSSGYWNLFDPTNGYTAIHADIARQLPYDKLSKRYFFETDMLFRLNTFRAVVVDVPMAAQYGDEISNLHVSKVVGEFLAKHIRNCFKRIFYNYYLRDMSLASIELPIGVGLLSFGVVFGCYRWLLSIERSLPAPTGTVMLAALPALMGLQLILAFLSYDISSVPQRPIHKRTRSRALTRPPI